MTETPENSSEETGDTPTNETSPPSAQDSDESTTGESTPGESTPGEITPGDAHPDDLTPHPFEFRGSAGEYFGIWIVNLLLSILTLGIYSAWAKVRTKRYFYGSTYVDDSAFEYHATPIQILIGRLIAVGAYIVFILTGFVPLLQAVLMLAFLFVVPWLIVRSLRFNARVSSYRNVRLGFHGTYGEALMAYILWPLAGFFTLGALLPFAAREQQKFLVNNATFGGRPLSAELSVGTFYKIYIVGLIIMFGLFAQFMIIFVGAIAAADGGDPSLAAMGSITLSYLALILGMVFVGVYIQTLVTNFVFDNMQVDGRHGFSSTMSPWTMLWIAVTNTLAIIATFGLMYPWARVRQVKYRASQTTFLAASDLSEFVSSVEDEDNAIGEEMAEIFDIDVGI